MKDIFLQKTIKFLSTYHEYNEDELEKLSYGLEGIYLTFTKLIVILFLAIFLHILKEVIIIIFLFNIIRYFGFGIHAKKSSQCLISSTLCFIGLPYILLHVKLSNSILIAVGIISIILLFIYAPADTTKRPLWNPKKRLIRKMLTTLVGIIYLVLAIYLHNFLSLLLIISILIEAIMIHPVTYKLMGQSYRNYARL